MRPIVNIGLYLYSLSKHKYNNAIMNPNFQNQPSSEPAEPWQPQPQPQTQPQPQPQTEQANNQFQPNNQFSNQQGNQIFSQPVSQPVNVPLAQPATMVKRSAGPWKILTIVFIFTTLLGAGLGAWALVNYLDVNNNAEANKNTAVNEAVKKRADDDAAAFLEKEKQPNRQFAGPEDYGQLSFDYPKTWSVYVNKDSSTGGTYEAYLHPVVVPAVSQSERYALRVIIENKDYDDVVDGYNRLVTSGELKASSFVVSEGASGTRLDGAFTKDIRGSAVIFKIRDKTVTIRTDADTFKSDFDALIKTIGYKA